MKIAIAGQAATTLNAHFGYAEFFQIFDIREDPPRFLETRRNAPHCVGGGRKESRLEQSVELLADCVAVMASNIGPCALDALLSNNIIAVEHPGNGLDGAGSLVAAIRTHLNDVYAKGASR